jgi:hypothetical protein
MKIPGFLITAACAGLLLTGCKRKETAPAAQQTSKTSVASSAAARAPATKTSFGEVTSQLDSGGDVFVYMSPEKWLSGLSTNLSGLRDALLSAIDEPEPQREQLKAAFSSAIRLLQASGVEDLTGVGLSGMQIGEDLYRSKFILHRREGSAKGFVWSVFGNAPHALRGLDMLPGNTGFAAFGDLELAQVWEIIRQELSKSGVPEIAQWAENWPKTFEAQTKIGWAELLKSLGGEAGLIVTLEPSRQLKMPVGEGIEFPEPALLLAVRVKNDLLYDRISAEFKKNKNAVVTNEPGLKISSLAFPLPLPVPLHLVAASSGDYVFFGTSPALVRSAMAVRQGKEPGLRKQGEFQELAKHVPSEGNSFVYVSRRLTESIQSVQKQVVQSRKGAGKEVALMERLLFNKQPMVLLSVGGQTASGWQSVAVGNSDSSALLVGAPAVGVTAVAAGLLLPAVAKAKARAESIKSVTQMKQIALAARLYANDHNGKFPPAENWCDALKEELVNFKVLKAPTDKDSGGDCSYAYNAKLSGLEEGRIHPETVAFFEAEAGWNQHGGPELMLPKPRHAGFYIIGFADGSVQQVPVAKKDSLRWNP